MRPLFDSLSRNIFAVIHAGTIGDQTYWCTITGMALNIPLVLHTVLEEYVLPWNGFHGVAHWARVLENGVRLAEETGAVLSVVQLFAVLHDCRRVNEHHDPEHGPRAAELAYALRGDVFALEDEHFRLLVRACAGHTHERTHHDVTIQTCWDADRLDLGRVGIMPDPGYLGTEIAKRRETICWADGRAALGFIPEFVRTEWGIDLEMESLERSHGRGTGSRSGRRRRPL